jgi:deazaflavin-dependent oxidoreductase (nitroreductase family)
MSEWNEKIIEEFRANGGAVGGMFEGAPLLLLTTVGARTGERRTNPVVHLRDGDRVLVFASNAGAASNPAWYHNLLANPQVTVEVGDGTDIETYTATAQPLRGEERDRAYARQAGLDPAFTAYQAGTARVIPVVALYRRDPARARALGDELVRIHEANPGGGARDGRPGRVR